MKATNVLQQLNTSSYKAICFNSTLFSKKDAQDENSKTDNNSETDWRNMYRHKKSNYGSTSYGNSGEGNDGSKKKSDRNLGGEINENNESGTA